VRFIVRTAYHLPIRDATGRGGRRIAGMLHGARPVIAINGEMTPGESPGVALKNRYADAVLKAGGIPVVVAPVGGPADVRRLLQRVDGLLLSGGDDFDTERLGLGPTHAAAKPVPGPKQDFDVELVREALDLQLPVLGICYGMQLMALVEGGELHQHLPEDRPGGAPHSGGVVHPVAIEPRSRLGALLEVSSLEVVSRHHQAVRSVGARWQVAGRDPEGLIEAIERADHPFAFGVQWHPELSAEGGPNDRLFRALVFAAGVRSARLRYPRAAAAIEAEPNAV
jgi:putative glutamine amidotransferase